jgi:hypothetical protein
MIRSVTTTVALLLLTAAAALPGSPQSNSDLQTFFRQDIGLSPDQIAAIRSGQPVAKNLPSRQPAEVFLFGAVYIHAAPESYLEFARDFDRLRKLPNYLTLGVFSNPPQLSDLKGFSFDSDEIQALQSCKPGDCQIQMPASSIEDVHRSIDWSAADVNAQVNQLLQKAVLQRLLAYQREGNRALGVITTSVTLRRCPNSSLTCSVMTRPCRNTCRISSITFSPTRTRNLRTSKTRSTGRE